MEEQGILNRWTSYFSELYNHEGCGESAVLNCSQPLEKEGIVRVGSSIRVNTVYQVVYLG